MRDETPGVRLSDEQMRSSLARLEARRRLMGADAACDEDLAALLSRLLVSLPPVRDGVVAAVKARLDAGSLPSGDDLACQILVGAPSGPPG